MSWVFIVLAAFAGALLLWGLIDPRGQWRVLVGWSTRNPEASEPGDAVQAVRRLVSAAGLAGVIAVVVVLVVGQVASQPKPAIAPTALELMWGTPVPRLVDRVIVPGTETPDGLVEGEVVAVQAIDAGFAPSYLITMPRWSRLGDAAPAGIVGSAAPKGATGYGLASLLISVRGPLLCIPRVVVVEETDTEIRVGVWFGPPDGVDSDLPVEEACASNASASERILLPVYLDADVDDRDVLTIDGQPVRIAGPVG